LKSLIKYSCFRCSKKYSNQVTDHLCCKSFW
jgi:DNA-directed RNA polymerase subunit RPC12/RpoP